ncbi:helix-turn-helix domain-containing protein, partial [Giesbergeria sinuosa]
DGHTIGQEQMRAALACGLAPAAGLIAPHGMEKIPPDDATLAHLLADYPGRRADLARSLGMSERSLYRRLRQLKGGG